MLTLQSERGSLAVEAGEFEIARKNLDAAIPGLVRAWGAGNPAVTQARESEATISELTGDFAACAARLAEVVAGIVAADGANSPRLNTPRIYQAHCLVRAGALEHAATVISAAAALDLDPAERASLELVSGRLAFTSGHRDRARAIAVAIERRIAAAEPDADLDLDLAALWAQLGNTSRAWELAKRAAATAGEDLASGELLVRAAEVALSIARHGDAAELGDRAVAIATASKAGPDMLARYRCLAARTRRQACGRLAE